MVIGDASGASREVPAPRAGERVTAARVVGPAGEIHRTALAAGETDLSRRPVGVNHEDPGATQKAADPFGRRRDWTTSFFESQRVGPGLRGPASSPQARPLPGGRVPNRCVFPKVMRTAYAARSRTGCLPLPRVWHENTAARREVSAIPTGLVNKTHDYRRSSHRTCRAGVMPAGFHWLLLV